MNINKKLAIPLVFIALVAGFGGWWYQHKQANASSVYHGNVDIRQVSLAFNGGDRIKEILTQEGDRVEAGQIMARLDTTTLALQLSQAKAQWTVQQQNAQQ